MTFADHFSKIAADYATYRPHYPPALATLLAEQSPSAGAIKLILNSTANTPAPGSISDNAA